MSAITDEFKHVVTTLEAEGHHLADRARAAFTHYEQDATAVVGEIRPVFDDFATRIETALAKVEALLAQQTPAQPTPPVTPPAAS